jgi:hypothetical protein
MNVINRLVGVVAKPSTIAKICKYKGLHEDTTLSRSPWRCTVNFYMIWIISSRNVLLFFIIHDREVIYLCLFAFNFSGSMLISFFNVL